MSSLERIFTDLPGIIPDLISQIKEIASCIHQFGWAEANSGNISVNITDELRTAGILDSLDDGRYLLVSRSGSRSRQMQYDVIPNIVLIRTDSHQEEIFPAGIKPTSEWISHRCIHDYFSSQRLANKVVLHAHASEAVAFSNNQLYGIGEYLHSEMYRVLPELKYYLPEGIGMCLYQEPGTEELCRESLARIKDHKALIWQKHGIVCFGADLDEAFDYLELVNKAAKIWLLQYRD